MADGSALFAAILAAPDDDAPRLVYADWLDEQGQGDRAELIRVQCEVARRPDEPAHGPTTSRADFFDPTGVPVPCPCPPCTARAREREILSAPDTQGGRADPAGPAHRAGGLRADWAGEPVRSQAESWAWVRGFVGKVRVPAHRWMEFGDRMLAAQPIRDVVLMTWPVYWTRGRQTAPAWLADDTGEALAAYQKRWPGVRFEPPGPVAEAVEVGAGAGLDRRFIVRGASDTRATLAAAGVPRLGERWRDAGATADAECYAVEAEAAGDEWRVTARFRWPDAGP